MDRKRIEDYARLLVEVGGNVQKGQLLVISASVESADFARLCVRAGYEAGAREVVVNWADDEVTRMKYQKADSAVFDTVHPWQKAFWDATCEKDVVWLSIRARDPELLSGVDPERILRAEKASGAAAKKFRERETRDYFSWSIGSLPIPSWAKKVFPDLSEQEAMEKLWDAILKTVRVNGDNDPVADWKTHNETLRRRADKLTEYNFKALHYENSLGTDLTVGLAKNHYWDGGRSHNANGTGFNANMPTEEIFTAPDKTGTNGVVYASMPLVLNGTVVENFGFRLENGQIVEVFGEKNVEILKNAIRVDEGASYLGEAALVPVDSPIAQSGILFYDTLYDENASCHLAFGDSYPLVKGFGEMTEEEQAKTGLNHSMTHIDFMIGTDDLQVTGITHDGKQIPVMVNGRFVI